jgi:hypothetical protein
MLETGETVFTEILHNGDAEPSSEGATRRG